MTGLRNSGNPPLTEQAGCICWGLPARDPACPAGPGHCHALPTAEHGNQGCVKRFGSWAVWCQCGFLETGWPNYAVARRSLDAHNEKVVA